MNILASNDATFKGSSVRADDTLNLNVANNLTVESVRDSSSSASHGMNASMGVSVGGNNSSLSGANASVGMNNSRSSEKQTVLTSLTGNTVNITTGENTHIKGALVAAGTTDDKGTFQDNNNLNLSTKTLTFENLANTKSSNSTGLGMGAGVSGNGISSVSAQLSTGTSYERTKTLATLGNGNINITDSVNSDEMDRLNRDTTNITKSLVKTSTGTSVDATLDTRMLTKEGRAQINQQYKDMDKNMNAITKTLPNAKSDNPVEAVAGTVWNTLATVSGGILPTESNHGGLLANIPIITGYDDSNFKVTGDSGSTIAYLNGQSNTLPDAIQGGNNLIGDVPHQNWYNPTHGVIGDTLESATDLLLNGFGIQTGISKQVDVLQNNGVAWIIYMHSQGNIIAKEGANTNTNTYRSYGSPLPSSVIKEIFNIKANKNDGDYVANPQNIVIPTTWFEPGHGTENYGAAKEAKEKNLNKKEE